MTQKTVGEMNSSNVYMLESNRTNRQICINSFQGEFKSGSFGRLTVGSVVGHAMMFEGDGGKTK